MALKREHFITPEDYLEIDRASEGVKYEYIDGHMHAMSGGTINHGQIAYNMANLVHTHLKGKTCRFFQSDVRFQVAEGKYFYPDLSVSCNPQDWLEGDADTIHAPCLVVEVLSPSTETRDRRVKWNFYQACLSIQEYVLVNTQCQLVEVFRRHADGNIWLYQQFRPGQEVSLTSVGLTFSLAALYDLTSVPIKEKEIE
jgi:Uma2 family endonuclease